MSNIQLIFIIIAMLLPLTHSTTCDGTDTAVRLVTQPSSTTVPTCTSSPTLKQYTISFSDITQNLQYSINKGVFIIDVPISSVNLQITIPDSSNSVPTYSLSQILIRSPAMHAITSLTFDAEMQLYFTPLNSSTSYPLSQIVISIPLTKSSSSSSEFFSQMNPTIMREAIALNFATTLKLDLSSAATVLEYDSAEYMQTIYTWLYTEKAIYISQLQYEAFSNQWSDPFRIYFFDDLSVSNSQCSTDTTTRYAFCSSTYILAAINILAFIALLF